MGPLPRSLAWYAVWSASKRLCNGYDGSSPGMGNQARSKTKTVALLIEIIPTIYNLKILQIKYITF